MFPKRFFAEIAEGELLCNTVIGYKNYIHLTKLETDLFVDITKKKKIWRISICILFFSIKIQFPRKPDDL